MKEQYQWYPISKLQMFENMVSESLDCTLEQYGTFLEAREKPHVLDDSIIDRAIKLFNDQVEETVYYDLQIARWKQSDITGNQKASLNKLTAKVDQYRNASKKVLHLLEELKKGTINRILEMSDGELALNVLSGKLKLPR